LQTFSQRVIYFLNTWFVTIVPLLWPFCTVHGLTQRTLHIQSLYVVSSPSVPSGRACPLFSLRMYCKTYFIPNPQSKSTPRRTLSHYSLAFDSLPQRDILLTCAGNLHPRCHKTYQQHCNRLPESQDYAFQKISIGGTSLCALDPSTNTAVPRMPCELMCSRQSLITTHSTLPSGHPSVQYYLLRATPRTWPGMY
jgi:hypothetical protein